MILVASLALAAFSDCSNANADAVLYSTAHGVTCVVLAAEDVPNAQSGLPVFLESPHKALRVLAVPLPMDVVRERLDARSTPVGLWNIEVTGAPGESVSREAVVIAIAQWCRANRAPIPLLLTKEQAWPIIARKAGGRWKTIQRLIGYAGAGAAIAGIPLAATAGPLVDLLSRGAADRIPDISALSAELPATITIPQSGGITLSAWSARMRQAPQVVGPLEVVSR